MSDPDFISAKREWMERYGSYIKQARNWRLAAFGAMGVAAIMGIGFAQQANKTHIVPYVVQVNHLGQSVRLARAVRAGAMQKPIVTHVLSRWIVDARERVSDPVAARQLFEQSYNFVDQNASVALNHYFKHHPPLANAKGNSNGTTDRTVQITSALPLGKLKPSGGTYQIQWTEKTRNATGQVVSAQNWQAVVSYSVSPPKSAAQATKNPFGIYITNFQWQKTA